METREQRTERLAAQLEGLSLALELPEARYPNDVRIDAKRVREHQPDTVVFTLHAWGSDVFFEGMEAAKGGWRSIEHFVSSHIEARPGSRFFVLGTRPEPVLIQSDSSAARISARIRDEIRG